MYQIAQAAKVTGVSPAGIRNYVDRYGEWFSAGARPPKGQARDFSGEDVRLIAFIRDRTKAGENHDQIVQALQAGELEDFTSWAEPPAAGEGSQAEEVGAELVPPAAVAMLRAMLEESRRREETAAARTDAQLAAAADRESRLQAAYAQAQREIGRLEGEIAAMKAAPPRPASWWRRVFGGE